MLQKHSNIGIIHVSQCTKESWNQKDMDHEALLKFLIDLLRRENRVLSIV